MAENKITIELQVAKLKHPVTNEIVQEAAAILNRVFNLDEFEQELSKQVFVATNRPDFARNNQISGADVYADFISKERLPVTVTVKRLLNPVKRGFSRTMGETDPSGTSIITYDWWLKGETEKELLIAYATHIGHELFHTNYFGYIHDPAINDHGFVNEKDVTYMIDDILERLIRKYYA